MKTLSDSPVDVALKEGPRGNGQWVGFDSVYAKISQACDAMGRARLIRGSDSHVDAMADLGSGHEERMKYRLMWLREYGWVK